jgi:HAE1 family hydrophobic/amphiphilic exporter-1
MTEKFFQGMLAVYDWSLKWALRARPVVMATFVIVLAATAYMFIKIPKGFIPDQDSDQLQVYTEAAQGTSYYQMVEYEKKIADVVAADPNVDALMASVGGTTATNLGGPNYGSLVVHLKPRNRRELGVNDLIRKLRPELSGFPGMKIYLQNPPTIKLAGR